MFTQRCSIIFLILFNLLRIICGVWYGDYSDEPINYMAAVMEDRIVGYNLCSGTIIAPDLVLTHAPCIYKLRGRVVVVVGTVDVTHPGIITDIKDVIPHEHYDPENGTNPVAIVQTMSKIIGPKSEIMNVTKNPWEDYNNCKFAGYGFRVYDESDVWYRNITNGILHSKAASQLEYKPATCGCLKIEEQEIKNLDLVCAMAGMAGLCVGDFGGPLVCDTSEGTVMVAMGANFEACDNYDGLDNYMKYFRQYPCAHTEQSTETYTFLYPFAKWIRSKIKSLEKKKISFSSANRLLLISRLSLWLFISAMNYITIL